jgi:uncharacterized protein
MDEPEVVAPPKPAPAAAPAAPQAKAAPVDDLMVLDHEDEPPPPVRPPAPAPRVSVRADDEGLVSEPVAAQAAGALGRLMGTMMVSSGATLDDVVRELLKPMLKEWLDANLPQMIEAEVAREIQRIRRMARV